MSTGNHTTEIIYDTEHLYIYGGTHIPAQSELTSLYKSFI